MKDQPKGMKEFDSAWKEYFKDKPHPKNDEEEKEQLENFNNWYNYVRKQSDTGKTPAEMYEEIYKEKPPKPHTTKPSRMKNFYWDDDYDEELAGLIFGLEEYDGERGNNLDYETIRKKIEPVTKKIIKKGEKSLDLLHLLLQKPNEWSCFFALEIIEEIKSEKSIPCLIKFIEKNELGDYWMCCGIASKTLKEIGKPCIKPLIGKIKKDFENKIYSPGIVDVLTGIKDNEVFKFMIDTVQDYIKNHKEYDSWFKIDCFTMNFSEQKGKERIPLLKKLVEMEHLSNGEKKEINSTIEIIENPKKYDKEIFEKMMEKEDFFKDLEKINRVVDGEGLTDKEKEEAQKRAKKPDDKFETNFICRDCKERQNLKTGLIYCMNNKDKNFYLFENEIMCKKCKSHNMKLSKKGEKELIEKNIRTSMFDDTGIVNLGETLYIENKEIHYKKAYDYILNRIKEEPENGEIYLRAGNTAKRFNKYKEAIGHYKKSLRLNPKLIGTYLNLVEVYEYRYKYYQTEKSKDSAIFYYNKMLDLFRSQDFDPVTIKNEEIIVIFLGEMSESLGINVPELYKVPLSSNEKKIGRNEPCPCGSGKKYKKCCLEV